MLKKQSWPNVIPAFLCWTEEDHEYLSGVPGSDTKLLWNRSHCLPDETAQHPKTRKTAIFKKTLSKCTLSEYQDLDLGEKMKKKMISLYTWNY
jgi:hypothetical protein